MTLLPICRILGIQLLLCFPLMAGAQKNISVNNTYLANYDDGWSTLKHFNTDDKNYIFMGMKRGFNQNGENARICSVDLDQGLSGMPIYEKRWSEGWSSTEFYTIAGQTYMMRLKERRNGNAGYNVQINRINRNGTVGSRIKTYDWSEGWTKVRTYSIADKTYLFLLKEHGTGRSGHNVHIHFFNDDGTIGRRIFERKWTSGWTSAEFFKNGNQAFLMRLKARGYDEPGFNVHIDRVNSDGTLGRRVKSYAWSEGWTNIKFFQLRGKPYLILLKKEGYGSSGKNLRIHPMNEDGSLGECVHEEKISEGWTTLEPFDVRGQQFMLRLMAKGRTSAGYNVVLDRIQ